MPLQSRNIGAIGGRRAYASSDAAKLARTGVGVSLLEPSSIWEHEATMREPAGAPLPDGVSVGHFTDEVGRTGCTVVLAPGGAVAGVDVRGAAAGTLNTEALRPATVIEIAHAVLLTGGSVYGLAAAGGVLRYLEERGVGFAFGSIRIPGVSGAVIFDLLSGDPRARPGPDAGYEACAAATRRRWSARSGRAPGRPSPRLATAPRYVAAVSASRAPR
jgi:peptidase S58-like protein